MRVSKVDVLTLNVKKKRPLIISTGAVSEINNVFVRIETDDGLVGWGEGSPFPLITGDSQHSNIYAAQPMARVLLGKDPRAIQLRMTELFKLCVGEVSVKCAFDMALYDICAQYAGVPLYLYLGGEKRPLKTDRTISLWSNTEETARVAEELKHAGFREVKIKTGRPGTEDLDHVRVAREVLGDNTAIRIDANGGWDFCNALNNLTKMVDLNVQYCEQPLPAWNTCGLAELRRKVNIPICADESVFDDKDALNVVRSNSADFINIKLGKSGGLFTAQKINAIAEAAGKACMIGCFMETRLALTAAAHFATAQKNVQFIDLDGARGHASDPILGGADFQYESGGEITVPNAPGLGCSLDSHAADIVYSVT